ncbi:MAG: PAS domain S-box protein [Deltaproteobacteria bacterium]|nr:PAS domain S-box protein [Deltaproteobacteria bacterium]MBW2364227.1 PAS domain S-box protein [Deltaproteobacteria bacterium]
MVKKPTYQDLEKRIQELEQAESDRKQSEERFGLLAEMADIAPNSILVHDFDGRMIYANKRTFEMHGYEKDEFMAINLRDIDVPESAKLITSRMKQIEEVGEASFEVSHIRKDGSIFPMLVYAKKIHWADEPAMLSISTDITERKQAEDSLRKSEKQYRLLANNVQDVIWTMDLNLRFTFVSPSIQTLRGYSADEVKEQSLDQILTPESFKKATDILARDWDNMLKGTFQPTVFNFEMTSRDGSTVWVESTLSVIYNADGTPKEILGISRDITERKQAEGALHRYKHIVSSSTDMLALLDRQYNYLAANKAYIDAFKITHEELIGNTVADVFGEEFFNAVIKPNGDRCLLGEEINYQNWFDFPGHGRRCMDITYYPYNGEDNKIMGFVVSGRNITERKKIEDERTKLQAQLQQAQKMEAIGTLAGGIAHDFNNLLMAITGYNSIIRLNTDTSHPHYKHLTEVEKCVESASELTRQLLGFARGGKYEVKPTDLNELVKDHNRMFSRTKKEITIHSKYEENLWTNEVDRGQIGQVLMNIYVNAWQAMPDGGELHIKTENVNIDKDYTKPFEVEPGKFVKISITDTGIGMPGETIDKIFDPFFTTKEKERGTGMGLSSAYGIIKNHGGFITVYSELDKGSTFNIFLPASEKKAAYVKKPSKKMKKGSGTILLIDDEQMMLDVGKEMLTGLGYAVLVAKGGKEGLEIYKENRDKIDMVILDMIMPGTTGSNTYDSLKKINNNIKVLLSSGYNINGKAIDILKRGCNGFIQKPFGMEQLSQKINEILTKK